MNTIWRDNLYASDGGTQFWSAENVGFGHSQCHDPTFSTRFTHGLSTSRSARLSPSRATRWVSWNGQGTWHRYRRSYCLWKHELLHRKHYKVPYATVGKCQDCHPKRFNIVVGLRKVHQVYGGYLQLRLLEMVDRDLCHCKSSSYFQALTWTDRNRRFSWTEYNSTRQVAFL